MSVTKLCGLGCVLWSSLSWSEVVVIPLQHRTVEEVLPVVRPLLTPDGAASGMNNQLILRGEPAALEEIRALLPSLDVPLRRLRITVLQDVDETTANRLRELSASLDVGHAARIGVAGSHGYSGWVVDAGPGEGRVRGREEASQMQLEDRKTQQVQVVEGGRALVRVGQSQPLRLRQRMVTPQGQTRIIETTQYREANSGFYVQPRLVGERVMVEITAQNDSPMPNNGGYARAQQVTTTVTGRLGEWLALGDLAQQASERNSNIGGSQSSNGRESRRIWLKVEEMR